MEKPDDVDEDFLNLMRDKLDRLWNSEVPVLVSSRKCTAEEALPSEAASYIKQGYCTFSSPTIEAFSENLNNFTHYDMQFWPVVAQTIVRGPWARLADSGFSLLDIPGNDPTHPAMYQRYLEGVRKCSKTFVLLEAINLWKAIDSTWKDLDIWASSSVTYLLTRGQSFFKDLSTKFKSTPGDLESLIVKVCHFLQLFL